jgi:hypothetical protein
MMAIFGWGDIVVVRVKRSGEGWLISRDRALEDEKMMPRGLRLENLRRVASQL